MLQIRRADQRGHADHGWLNSYHTFSFGDYYDTAWQGYSALRVINEDRVAAGAGFSPHSHRDMEIISYVLDGGLRHRDSTGGGSVLLPGELQLMSAGSGISHSEMNASPVDPVHFLQIWIQPSVQGIAPGYQQKALDTQSLQQGFTTVVAPAAENAAFVIHQDARVLLAWPVADQLLEQSLDAQRRYYLHVASGAVRVGAESLQAGDALMLHGETALGLSATEDAQLLLFDLP